MTQSNPTKCSYFNSGYCKFIKKENGCRYAHPTECCKIPKCKDKGCPLRHPKKCRHGEECRYQTKCMYKHCNNEANTTQHLNELIDEKVLSLTAEIECLKAEIDKLKSENDRKVNELSKIHFLELQNIQKENVSLKSTLTISNVNKIKHGEQVEVYEKEIIDLKYQNEKLQKTLIFKESLDVTLASRDIELAKAEADVEELKQLTII